MEYTNRKKLKREAENLSESFIDKDIDVCYVFINWIWDV